MSDTIALHFLEDIYPKIKETSLFGRWIRLNDIEPLCHKMPDFISVTQSGRSEEGRPLYRLTLGTGPKRILIWSQMHGNESTGTRAVFDFLNFITSFLSHPIVQTLLQNCTIVVLPMVNPDGAERYSRFNANDIDLNRDAVDRVAKESKWLRHTLEEFQPHFCFNLHDQRTIFGIENTQNPATLSFLAPSEDEARNVTEGRKKTMAVIVAMNTLLQQVIPNHIGRYTDTFYPTATGDTFQKLGYHTVLIEAGHFKDDYNREVVRKYNFYALLQGLYYITTTEQFSTYQPYFDIPANVELFYDVIHRYKQVPDVAYQYKESVVEGVFTFALQKVDKKVDSYRIGHFELDADR